MGYKNFLTYLLKFLIYCNNFDRKPYKNKHNSTSISTIKNHLESEFVYLSINILLSNGDAIHNNFDKDSTYNDIFDFVKK
jgi:hypothetical protein